MLRPFEHVAEADLLLRDRYPDSECFAKAWNALPPLRREGVLRSFLIEGVPAAFVFAPTLYETIRDFVAGRLGVDARNVTLVGSARLGYSLAPPPYYGTSFGSNSDLDYAVLSEELFRKLVDVFEQWKSDVAAGRERTRNAREEKFWEENLKILPRNIQFGFIDSHKIPNRYEVAMRVSQTTWLIREKLKLTGFNPVVTHISLRAYRDWASFRAQLLRNLRSAITKFNHQQANYHVPQG